MSNSRALASNQRPNKTTPSRRACGFSTLVFAALRRPRFEILRHFLYLLCLLPSSLVLSTPFLPHRTRSRLPRWRPTSSTAKTSHFAETRATPDAGKRVFILPLLTAPPRFPSSVPAYSFRSRLCHPFRSSHGAGWKSRERFADSHVDEIFSRILPTIAGLSASMCIFT